VFVDNVNGHVILLCIFLGRHQGTLFFPLPDGSGLLYNIIGNSEPPRASGKFVREVPCKTPYTETLPIKNWLKKSQRFHVTHEVVKQDRPEVATTIKYLEYIDVAAKSEHHFKLQFYSYKECSQHIKLTFKNEQTLEYLWYEMTFKSIADKRNAPTIANIDLSTHVRQQTSHDIVLENPLPHKVTFQGQCNHADILLPPEQVSIPANSQVNIFIVVKLISMYHCFYICRASSILRARSILPICH
jgi:hydrocephalus-inducing protein